MFGGVEKIHGGGGRGQVVVEQPGQRGAPVVLAVLLVGAVPRRTRGAGRACGTGRARTRLTRCARPARPAGRGRRPGRCRRARRRRAASISAPGCSAEQPEQPGGRRRAAAGTTRRTPPARRRGRRRRRASRSSRRPLVGELRRPGRRAGVAGRAAASSAATRSASGSRAHRSASSAAASGSASTRSAEQAGAAAPQASAGGSRSRSSRRAPSRATRPARRSRLVTSARQRGLPGSSGRTCSARGRCPARPASAGRPAGCGRRAARSSTVERDRSGRHAERVAGSRRARRPAATGWSGVVAAQVHVQLAVGEPVGDPVRPVHGQRGLADPGRCRRSPRSPPPCRRLRRLRGGLHRRLCEQAVQSGELTGAAGEPVYPGRHPRGTGRTDRRTRWSCAGCPRSAGVSTGSPCRIRW